MLLARDRGGPKPAAQFLIYPMLDDRPVIPDPHINPFLLWSVDNNITGWNALLGHRADTGDSLSGRDSIPSEGKDGQATPHLPAAQG